VWRQRLAGANQSTPAIGHNRVEDLHATVSVGAGAEIRRRVSASASHLPQRSALSGKIDFSLRMR